jgi:DNA segregation ATPase FtsK/SpoIIIE, S-DNA-T family
MTTSLYTEDQQTSIARLTVKMNALGYNATFSHLENGPIITQYYFKPDPVSPLTKVLNKTEDLALACAVETVLVTREKGLINVSVPNRIRSRIDFDACLYWLAMQPNIGLPLLMGQTPTGTNFTLDLCTQPHMLIAGSTGSGKSVFLSQLIASLAIQKSPHELKMLLVDTKQVDLPLFNPLPHVIAVVDKVIDLHTHLDRMLDIVRQRTQAMKGIARNIAEYNSLTSKGLPYYVIVIDELADVISLDLELGKNEDAESKQTRISAKLAQIAQISRASGIHIIAATQRPSVKILSGDIKANFPTRISFRLPTGTDSRVVLDENGAESLLGRGDYLYRTAESSEVRRAHGSFVSLQDIAKVLDQHQQIREQFTYMREQELINANKS